MTVEQTSDDSPDGGFLPADVIAAFIVLSTAPFFTAMMLADGTWKRSSEALQNAMIGAVSLWFAFALGFHLKNEAIMAALESSAQTVVETFQWAVETFQWALQTAGGVDTILSAAVPLLFVVGVFYIVRAIFAGSDTDD